MIHTPQEKIFEGVVSFTAVRRIGIPGKASIAAARNIPEKGVPGEYPPWASGGKQVYCAACETVTTQDTEVDKNGEIVLTCQCGRFLNFRSVQRRRNLMRTWKVIAGRVSGSHTQTEQYPAKGISVF